MLLPDKIQHDQSNGSPKVSKSARADCGYSVHYKFSGDFSPIDQWLSKNCTGKYDYSLDSSSQESGDMLDIVLKFEQKEDRIRFKDMILSGHT